MDKQIDRAPEAMVDSAPRARWQAPRLRRIDAADAEVGTRTKSDGAFTTS